MEIFSILTLRQILDTIYINQKGYIALDVES